MLPIRRQRHPVLTQQEEYGHLELGMSQPPWLEKKKTKIKK